MGIQRLNDRGKGGIYNTRVQSGHEGTNGNTERDPPLPIHCRHGHKPKFKQILDILQGTIELQISDFRLKKLKWENSLSRFF